MDGRKLRPWRGWSPSPTSAIILVVSICVWRLYRARSLQLMRRATTIGHLRVISVWSSNRMQIGGQGSFGLCRRDAELAFGFVVVVVVPLKSRRLRCSLCSSTRPSQQLQSELRNPARSVHSLTQLHAEDAFWRKLIFNFTWQSIIHRHPCLLRILKDAKCT